MTINREMRGLDHCFLSARLLKTATMMSFNRFFIASFREITDFENEGS